MKKVFQKGSTLSVKALRLCQLPRGGSLHICKGSSSERSGCPSHTTSPSSSLTLDATSPSRGGLGRRFVFRLIRLRLQNHHLPQGKDFAPAGQTGAKRQTPKTRRYAKGSPTRQQRRPPPVAETGRSCWGSGQQGMSGSEMTAGSRNPYGGIPKG